MHKQALAIVGSMATGVALLVAGLTIALIVPAAGTAAPRLPKIDLATDAAVHSYLRSVGVDPATVVIQRGLNNYAGPRCPGVGWNCTAATSVVQIASGSGTNIYQGNPEFFASGEPPFPVPETFVPLSPPTGTPCTVVQETVSGQNHARCFQRSTTTPATLTAMVTQTNELGDNFFQGHQQIRQRSGAIQMGEIDLDLDQNNSAGNNHAHALMQIFQSTSEVTSTSMQTQNGTFDASPWDQDTETGNNFGHLTQALNQDGRASGPPTIVQNQFGDHFGDVDQFAEPAGEILAQSTGEAGFSKFFAYQSETQSLTGPGTQNQDGPMNCCGAGTQTGDEEETSFNIDQSSTQKASQFPSGTVSQIQELHGDCDTTGTCTIKHNATNEADSLNHQTSGTGVQELFTTCSAFSSGGESGGNCSSGGD